MKIAVLDTEKLSVYMEQKKINTSVLASKIGVSPSCLSRVLNNKRPPGGIVWEGLIGFFGKKVFEFIFFKEIVSNDTYKNGNQEE